MSDEHSIYAARGVSASKEEVHKAIKSLDKGLYDKAFCKILPDYLAGDPDFCNIMHADTAGTKTSLAYLYWKETGDLSVWRGIVQDAMVMNLDDMACVGCIDNIILSSTIGRNKNLIPGEVLEALIGGTQDFLQQLAALGIQVTLAGGETADVGDIVRTVDVGFTTFARLRKSELIVNHIQPGDVVVGLASFGQTTYEDKYNAGMGSNGLTSARHDLLSKFYASEYVDSFDPNTPAEVVYSGPHRLTDPIILADGRQTDIGKMILSPTRTYLPVLREILDQHRKDVHGLIHCTGGGQSKVLKFIDQVVVIKDDMFPIPKLFQLIKASSGATWHEMYQVFNMGHRMEVYTSEAVAANIIEICRAFDLEAQIIGRVEANEVPEVRVEHGLGQEIYRA